MHVLDYAPDESDSVMIARISKIKTDIPVTFNSTVRRFIDFYTIERRDYTRKMLYRHKAYFPMFEEKLQKNGLPVALKYLTIVESGINPTVKSPAGALGLWQFMPYTGKVYDLNYDYYIDERMNPEKATDAACAYLGQLYNMFHDWELALAAYNCGPGNVRKAIRRSGYKKTFWEIYRYLPRETRGYVPQFMAMIYIMNYADEHNLYTESYQNLPESTTVITSQYINLKLLAKELDICYEELTLLNPEIKRGTISERHENYELNIPAYRANFFKENRVAILDSVGKKGRETISNGNEASKVRIVYVVKRGDVLGKIAERYHVRLSDLRTWNRINSRNTIRVGQKLEIYTSSKNAYNSRKTTAVASREAPSIYIVKRGDSLWTISRRYKGLSVEKIKQLNGLTSNELKIGQKLRLS